MSVIINASTTSGLVMTSDLSGSLQFQNNGVNLPMGGVAPAFSAYQSVAQSLTANVATKITFTTEEFDTNNNFASSTFTPTVAGYYQVNSAFVCSGTRTYNIIYVYKNGANYKSSNAGNSVTGTGASISCLVYCNGSTDYIDIYGLTGFTQNTSNTLSDIYFQACLVRGA